MIIGQPDTRMGHGQRPSALDLAVVAQVLTELHRPLDTVQPNVPQKLALICDRLLNKAAATRPSDASQVRRAIEAVAAPDYEAVWSAAKVAGPNCSSVKSATEISLPGLQIPRPF